MRDIIMALVDVAAGRAKAQMVFKNINLVNVFTGEIYKTDVAIHDGYIAGIGEYTGATELDMEGIAGIKYILEGTENLPVDVYIMLPSCVPATPFENSGSVLKAEDLMELINHPRVLGLGELMDFTNVIHNEKSIMNKIILARNSNKFIDGHNPLLSGRELNAYVAAGVRTEHECISAEGAREH